MTLIISQVNKELITLSSWFKKNKLSLNTNKTKFILFRSQNRAPPESTPEIVMNEMLIEQVSDQKFLGVHIDQKLDWKIHLNITYNKISRNVGVLSRLKNMLPSPILKTLDNTLILPYLSYGVVAWGDTCKKEIKRMLQNCM